MHPAQAVADEPPDCPFAGLSAPMTSVLPAEKVRGLKNRESDISAAGVLSAAPLTYSLRGDYSAFVVFCFAKAGRRAGLCQSP
jgi:hypothetical protein